MSQDSMNWRSGKTEAMNFIFCLFLITMVALNCYASRPGITELNKKKKELILHALLFFKFSKIKAQQTVFQIIFFNFAFSVSAFCHSKCQKLFDALEKQSISSCGKKKSTELCHP